MRLIHTADWQLGKPFRRFEADVRNSLTDARFDAIDTIGRVAATDAVDHVLVAGDVFDTFGPEDRVIVQAISRMARYPCQWWLLPGNHDYVRSGGLWDRIRSKAAPNLQILAEPAPVEMEDGVWILPAPLEHRHQLEDPTQAFDTMETPGASLRIGIGHGSIRDFGSRGETRNQIAPDRADRSGLDYLALGDWHGALSVNNRCWYSGTPETDRFQRDDPGQILLVDVQPSREPEVTPIRSGRFQWLVRDWSLSNAEAFEAEWNALAGAIEPSSTLLQLAITGIMNLTDRVNTLARLENDIRHMLRHLDLRVDNLVARPTQDDLAGLAVEGILGSAAGKLNNKIEAGGPEAAIAKRALERLFVEYQRELAQA